MNRSPPTCRLSASSAPSKLAPDHAKVTIDFCAVQIRPFFEGNTIAQQITLNMQTIGGKIASDHRIIKPDQAVRMRVVQRDRAFNPAVDESRLVE